MNPLAVRPIAWFVYFLLAQKIFLFAQAGAELHRYDARLEYFSETTEKDSFLVYFNKKSLLARQTDSLAAWGWAQVKYCDFFLQDSEEALRQIDVLEKNRWREPKNVEEWEPFLYLEESRGWHLFKTGRVWQSVQAYENAARHYEQFRYADFDAIESIYKPLGNHYTRLGDNEKALAVFQKALLLGGDNEILSGLYCNIGIAYWNQGDLATSEIQLKKGLGLPGISDVRQTQLLAALAQTQSDGNQIRESYSTASQALRLLPANSKDPRVVEYGARARRTAGEAAIALGHLSEAERLLSSALADATVAFGDISRDVGKIHIARSKVFLLQGKFLPALESANRALTAVLPNFQPKKAEENPLASSFYEENVIFEALEAKAAAAKLLYEKSGALNFLQLALECHDLAWQAEMRLRKVFQYGSSKLNLQKTARAREESAMNVARMLYEKTGQITYLEKGFAIAERSKAALLLEALQDNLVRQRLAGSDIRFNQLGALRLSFSYFEKNLLFEPNSEQAPQWRIEADALIGQIAALERDLAKNYPNLADFGAATAGSPPAFGELADGEALVAYFVSEQFVDVFIFQKNKPAAWQRLPHDAALQELVRRFLAYFENSAAILNDPTGYLQTAFALWQKIMPSEASQAAKITIVPDGFLNFIPFEALVDAVPNGASLRNAPYLIKKQEIRYAWSLAVLRQQNNLKSHARGYLLAVAPGFTNGERGLAPLQTGDDEWQFAGWGLKELEGETADLQRVLKEAGRHRVLHFATHAFSDANPRIELYDQALYLPDIYALSLQADLVVLSACQTGLGREQKGEGVMSLARAFAQAGAACIVSSLWSVNDRSTAQVLNRFYENLGGGKAVSVALRQAKLAYLNDSNVSATMQSPYFWAGLSAVGADHFSAKNGLGDWLWLLILGGVIVIFTFILYQYFVRNRHFQSKNRPKTVGAK